METRKIAVSAWWIRYGLRMIDVQRMVVLKVDNTDRKSSDGLWGDGENIKRGRHVTSMRASK